MSGPKHPKARPGAARPRDDLESNPGIGMSKGTFATGEDPKSIAGESTFEGDVENDTTPQRSIDPGQRGRTNK